MTDRERQPEDDHGGPFCDCGECEACYRSQIERLRGDLANERACCDEERRLKLAARDELASERAGHAVTARTLVEVTNEVELLRGDVEMCRGISARLEAQSFTAGEDRDGRGRVSLCGVHCGVCGDPCTGRKYHEARDHRCERHGYGPKARP
jgi:hypothetical protein